MIPANELRIGNWAYDKKINRNIQFTSFFGLCNIESRPDDYDPIPLTPGVLEACGFRWNGDRGSSKHYFLNGLRIALPSLVLSILRDCNAAGESQAGLCGKSIGDRIYLKHLHQLQNLYFALTGDELPVNLQTPTP